MGHDELDGRLNDNYKTEITGLTTKIYIGLTYEVTELVNDIIKIIRGTELNTRHILERSN